MGRGLQYIRETASRHMGGCGQAGNNEVIENESERESCCRLSEQGSGGEGRGKKSSDIVSEMSSGAEA